jgi:hypothetical protein
MCRGTISFANGAIEVEATVNAEALDLPPEALIVDGGRRKLRPILALSVVSPVQTQAAMGARGASVNVGDRCLLTRDKPLP